MPIDVVCRNGHQLKLKEKYAGKKGLCPRCGVAIDVPTLPALSEDALVDLLAPDPASPDQDGAAKAPVHQEPSQVATVTGGSTTASGMSLLGPTSMGRSLKVCPSCHSEISAGYHVCPHCHMYFSDNSEVHRRMAWLCKHCGEPVLPKDRYCAKCRKPLK